MNREFRAHILRLEDRGEPINRFKPRLDACGPGRELGEGNEDFMSSF